jgi:NADH-quinone oxidoreductase subunit J
MWEETLFYIFSTLMIVSGLCVVFSRNVVNSALYMVVVLAAMSGLFVLLDAYLLAILQILVYAGAVMVLFLFIIMLIDVDAQKKIKGDAISLVSSLLVVLFVSCGIGIMVKSAPFKFMETMQLFPATALPRMEGGLMSFSASAKGFGLLMFSKYVLPFELAGVLLLMAIVGVMVLSKVSARVQEGGNNQSAKRK